MEGVSAFLEASTVHGLIYISTTRKYARLFWIIVVLTGFLGAILLIKESFDSWSESPIKTTIETLPISEIKLPKVTVCPPKNTFTDLNHDLMMTENITLTEEMRYEMFKYAVDVINEDSFTLNNWTKLREEDKFYNWYHGYTQIKSPYIKEADGVNIYIDTAATSGVVTTQYYGDQFRPELVERKLHYDIHVYPPKSALDSMNVTLHLKLEKVSMTGITTGVRDSELKRERYTMGWRWGVTNLYADQTIVYKNYTPSQLQNSYFMYLIRDVGFMDVDTQTLDVMPGFRFTWWYTQSDVKPDNMYKDEDITKLFVR